MAFIFGCAPMASNVIDSSQTVSHDKALSEEKMLLSAKDTAPFPVGERLVFSVRWLMIHAGEIVSEVKGVEDVHGRKAYRIEVTARTVGFCSKLYRIEDRYISYMDVEELHTLRYEEHRREGSYVRDAVTDFDQENHKARFKNFTDKSEKVYDIPEHVQDTVTAAYYARLLPLKVGRSFGIMAANSERVFDLFVAIPRIERVAGLSGKEEDAFFLQPFAHCNGQKVREGKLHGFVSTGKGREPLLIVIQAPVFTQVTAALVSVNQ
ncbi:MAG: DUF3108 domain-containing protein [Candidatus Omnitrophica bacterium]|nr:DUF3108 domain-containing protein [Candidatus Omnitrophota bacterium]